MRTHASVLVTLTSGLLSFILLSTLESGIQQALSARARDLLGADLALSSRRWLQDSEIARARNALREESGEEPRELEVLEMFSMASSPGRTPQLVELNAVPQGYPLIGALEFQKPEPEACKSPAACVYGDATLELRWELKAGVSEITVGAHRFVWGGRIQRDTSRSLRGGALAPRLILRREALPATGLLRTGATFTTRRLFAVKPLGGEVLKNLARRLDRVLTDPGIQIQVPEDAAADEGRLLSSVGDFLGLTSLVGLLLAFLGCYWLLRRVIRQDAQSWAIYRVLSPRAWKADLPFWKLSVLLALGASALSLGLAAISWKLAGPALSRLLFMEGLLSSTVGAATILQAVGLALGTLCLALIPSLRFLRRQNLMELLRNPGILAQKPGFTRADLAMLIPVLFLAARWVAHSWWVAGVFMASLIAAAGLLWAAGAAFLSLIQRTVPALPDAGRRYSLLALSRLRSSTLLLWGTFSLGALLITLMPLLEGSLRRQLNDPREAGPVPGLFLFDIQEEQLQAVHDWARTNGSELQFETPLIRGRLLKVNDSPFEKMAGGASTREEEREARFRNRGFNLTYRSGLSPSERLVAGRGFERSAPRPADAPEAVTVERRFADRLGLRLGDRLLFDIQGVPITAEIVGLRQVQWTSFQPNFFVVFEPRALIDAPKTFLASLPAMGAAPREKLQRLLFSSFPNVSTIDVTRVMETLLEGFGQISQALALMAALASAAGGVAVFSVARLRTAERRAELQLLRLLGMDGGTLTRVLVGELAVLASASALAGMLLATLIAGALSSWIFESPVELPSIRLAASVLGGFLLLGSALGWVASRRSTSEEPGRWLRALSQET